MQPLTRTTMALTIRTHSFKMQRLKIYLVISNNTCMSPRLSLTTTAERMRTHRVATPSSQLTEAFTRTNPLNRILTGWARKPLGFTLQVKQVAMRLRHCCREAQTARGLCMSHHRGLSSRTLLARTRSLGMEILSTQTFRCGRIRHQPQPTWPIDSSKRTRWNNSNLEHQSTKVGATASKMLPARLILII